MATCECPVEFKTIYRDNFKKYPKTKPAQLLRPIQRDREILTGYAPNNLKVNGKIVTTKVWPNILSHAEEYKDFLKRFECCKYTNEIFKENFECPPVDISIIDDMIKNLGKTVYQLSYSPTEYTPKKEKCRIAKLTDSFDTKFYETTYRTSFNYMFDFGGFKETRHREVKKIDKANEVRNALKKMCTCGRTTYQDTMSLAGKLYAKVTPTAPIDRYTLRKV